MGRGVGLLAIAALALASAASAGAVNLHGVFSVGFHRVDCAPGTPASMGCYLNTGEGTIPGLGDARETYTIVADQSTNCVHLTFTPATIAVAGKGEIDAALTQTDACAPPPNATQTVQFTITGGSGAYAGASGGGTLTTTPALEKSPGVGTDADTWSGSIAAPNQDFDTTPPAISGTSNVVVSTKARSGAHVRYAPFAMDTADGTVPVTCLPKAGSLFPIGRTTVKCTAADASGNTATARFTVTVRRTK